jgi:ABC-type nitrate/sulfonate/bicarbonate transport system substrate-binding protein
MRVPRENKIVAVRARIMSPQPHKRVTAGSLLLISLIVIFAVPAKGSCQDRRRIRISNANLSFTALPLVAAREWKLFDQQGLDIEIILMRSAAAAAALASGDLDYQSGIGTASVSASLSGLDARALWSSTNRIVYWLMAGAQLKNVRDLRQKKIGVTGLGGTSHVALTAALEKSGIGPKEYVAVSVPSAQLVQALESRFVDAASLNPPFMFFAQRRGFAKLLDIGALVEMPSGGLTALVKTIKSRPDEVKRVVRALQTAKAIMLKSRERTLDLITHVLKMDRETAADTYKLVESNFNDTGIPTPEGMANIVKAIKAEGRFTDRTVSFEEVAEPRFAIEVAKELGYKLP